MKKPFPTLGNGNGRLVFPGMVGNGNSRSPLQLTGSGEQQPLRDQRHRHRDEVVKQLGGRAEDSLRCFERQYVTSWIYGKL